MVNITLLKATALNYIEDLIGAERTRAQAAENSLQTQVNERAPGTHNHTVSQLTDATTAGRGIMLANDVAAQRNHLGLGDMALWNTGSSGLDQHTWNDGSDGRERIISPGKLHSKLWDFFNRHSLGWGQYWHDVLGQRARDVWYHNNTGRPIVVSVSTGTGNHIDLLWSNNGGASHINIGSNNGTYGGRGYVSEVIPNNSWYRISAGGQNPILIRWAELR